MEGKKHTKLLKPVHIKHQSPSHGATLNKMPTKHSDKNNKKEDKSQVTAIDYRTYLTWTCLKSQKIDQQYLSQPKAANCALSVSTTNYSLSKTSCEYMVI